MADDIHYKPAALIRRGPEFYELYADSGAPPAEAPMHRATVKFKAAGNQMDSADLSAIRAFDRARSGGFVSG